MDQSVLTAAYQSALQIGVGAGLREGDFRDLAVGMEPERILDRVFCTEYAMMQPAILPEDIQCQAMRRTESRDRAILPAGSAGKGRQEVDLLIPSLKEQLSDSGADTEVAVDLERGMRVKEVGVGTAAQKMHLTVCRSGTQLLLDQGQSMISVMQTGPHVDLPSQAPTGAVIAADLQRTLAGLRQFRRGFRRDLMCRMEPVQMGNMAVMGIIFLILLFPFQ